MPAGGKPYGKGVKNMRVGTHRADVETGDMGPEFAEVFKEAGHAKANLSPARQKLNEGLAARVRRTKVAAVRAGFGSRLKKVAGDIAHGAKEAVRQGKQAGETIKGRFRKIKEFTR